MTETTTPTTEAPAKIPGLFSRAIGVLFSPAETMKAVATKPKWLGMLLLVLVCTAVPVGWFMTTEPGRDAALEKAQQGMKLFSSLMTPEQMEQQKARTEQMYKEGSALRIAGMPIATIIIMTPIVGLIYAGLLMLIFGVAMGGKASFKEVYAVVVHSWVVTAFATLILTPLNYFRSSMDSGATLRIFVPMLDDSSFIAQLLGNIDLFRLWWLLVLSIGLAVIYKRKTSSVATTLFVVYGVIAIGVAAVMTLVASRG